MKLINKITGEIADLEHKGLVKSDPMGKLVVWKTNANDFEEYDSLADLNEEWEDYEEPKEFKSVGNIGNSVHIEFETEEEAKKAVEKLKAWKRLKDKGFRFIDHIDRDSGQGMTRYEWDGYVNGEDLDLLFGVEE